ncbi:Mss4-like protein [Boeremia exigua]|uniref:Mss4-like protein n=1 Tax=Boeremia exigua TaxID=749465 RepID=UPI001E8D8680|nr:Mss4-like protein [Boeremia exigua]KAH6625495.1 Mss4-like protein [Boeremia exigua]
MATLMANSPPEQGSTTAKDAKTTKPFPAITGGCYCGAVRYRILTAPLFCYACHCIDCQKATGSAFALHATIEAYNISIISKTKPSLITSRREPSKPQNIARRALCSTCGTILWGNDSGWGYAVNDVMIGTLDFPGIMEPDAHSFVGSKLGWISLPSGARATKGQFDYKKEWPKSSLKRLEVCLERFEAAKKALAAQGQKPEAKSESALDAVVDAGVDVDGDKTPTATADTDEGEDDAAFEERFRETERALQERLAKLTLKLEGEDGHSAAGSTATGEATG